MLLYVNETDTVYVSVDIYLFAAKRAKPVGSDRFIYNGTETINVTDLDGVKERIWYCTHHRCLPPHQYGPIR